MGHLNVVLLKWCFLRLDGINVGFIVGYFDLTIDGLNLFFFLILEANSVQKGHSACS